MPREGLSPWQRFPPLAGVLNVVPLKLVPPHTSASGRASELVPHQSPLGEPPPPPAPGAGDHTRAILAQVWAPALLTLFVSRPCLDLWVIPVSVPQARGLWTVVSRAPTT